LGSLDFIPERTKTDTIGPLGHSLGQTPRQTRSYAVSPHRVHLAVEPLIKRFSRILGTADARLAGECLQPLGRRLEPGREPSTAPWTLARMQRVRIVLTQALTRSLVRAGAPRVRQQKNWAERALLLKRTTGLEPATFGLGSRRSTS
jgi:hypothetical protein